MRYRLECGAAFQDPELRIRTRFPAGVMKRRPLLLHLTVGEAGSVIGDSAGDAARFSCFCRT